MGYMKDKWIESMEPKPHEWERRWIPVDESLPDVGQVVLAYRPDVPPQSFTVAVCLYSKHLPENEYGFRTDWADDIKPTHWMVLPEPPQVMP